MHTFKIDRNKSDQPLVSVGFPVFNGEKHIKYALDSLIEQEYANLEILILDNASDDKTETICKEYEKIDRRITYIRNAENIGAAKNFNRAFLLSSGDYFMWAAHDDIWEKDFIKVSLEALQKNTDKLLCLSEVSFIDENNQPIQDTYKMFNPANLSVTEKVEQWVQKFEWFETYGLYRSETLKQTELMKEIFGPDVVLSLELLLKGEFLNINKVLFHKRRIKKSADDHIHEITTNRTLQEKMNHGPYTQLAREMFKVLETSELKPDLKESAKKVYIQTLLKTPMWIYCLMTEGVIKKLNKQGLLEHFNQ